MSIRKKYFGTLASGEDVSLYVLESGDYSASWTDYGATWMTMYAPDSRGNRDDLILGHSCLSAYASERASLGSTVGRFANRIAAGRFSLEGKSYQLFRNNGPNHLHGGLTGFAHRAWKSEIDRVDGRDCVTFYRTSPDGEEGYPGGLEARVRVSLSGEGKLRIEYEADSDAPTPVNLTNHVYFNLAGEGRGPVGDHELQLSASRYLEVDDSQIPLPGAPRSVLDTKYDFRSAKSLGPFLGSDAPESGFDHCFVLDPHADDSPVSVLSHAASGRVMKTRTSMPGIQLYTANNLAAKIGKSGHIYSRHSALCLETEYFPDSPNRPDFPDCLARPGTTWRSWTEYEFSYCI